ncbi:GMP synthase [Sulfuriferula plumbiphila]|uniref:GMP synthase n=1 Tax=Sulfuriferula plumbiphila TaxID=171865 RepID=A0A512L8D4_9PROT|nr:type 1 glutamine amidotransferase [Sulfuriferula plumbiphila]BBP05374.1 GMP synthase [Sulfuriferula plumbiphila]GEP30411.1 GMP synthase [Sulfuriferula plumbiphila]
MKTVAIFRHTPSEGPGYFATFLNNNDIPWEIIKVDQGQPIPDDPAAYAGLVFMGGPMSVNDPLPWIPPILQLIRAAVAADVPVLGHCLGGQLISKALGGVVTRNPVKEIGWGDISAADNDAARAWLDGLTQFEGFHWHGETFSLPNAAVRIMSSAHCENQAYVIGKHLAMQCHVEMTPTMIRTWCNSWVDEIAASDSSAVQTPEIMQANMESRLIALNQVADRLYARWIKGLAQ